MRRTVDLGSVHAGRRRSVLLKWTANTLLALIQFALQLFVMYNWFRLEGEMFHLAAVAIGLFIYWQVKSWRGGT